MKEFKISAHMHNLILRKRAFANGQREISRELNIPQTTIHRNINRERQNPGAPYRTSSSLKEDKFDRSCHSFSNTMGTVFNQY